MRLPSRRALPSLFLLILIPVATGAPLTACPPYIDLWEEIENADLILLAEVEKVEPTLLARWVEYESPALDSVLVEISPSPWLEALTDIIPDSWREPPPLSRWSLRPSQSWKGPLPRRLRVGSPATGREIEGGKFLIFLHRGIWGWTATWRIPRALLEQSEDPEALRRWVERAVELQRRSPGSPAARIEWLIEGVSVPELRSWAVVDLDLRRSRREDSPGLTQAQQAVIAAAFVADPPQDRSLSSTLRLLEGYEDPLVDQVAVGVVADLFEELSPEWWIPDVLNLTLRRLGAQDALRLLAAEERWPVDWVAIRRIWKRGLEEAGSDLVPDLGDRLAIDGQIPAARVAEGGEGDLEAGGA